MMKRVLSMFNKLDWLVGGAFLLVGLYLMQPWVIAGGVVGLLSAYYQPAAYLSKKLEDKLLTKSAQASQNSIALSEDEFYLKQLKGDALEQARATESASTTAAPKPMLLIWNARHNHLSPAAVATFTKEDLALDNPIRALHRSYH